METASERAVRYSRQIIIPEIGPKGQEKLRRGKVLIIGAGGLGSPAAYYLAAAGVGMIGVVDNDVVDLSNLQRQILHSVKDIGRPKTDSALEKLSALNPDCVLVPCRERFTAINASEIIDKFDIVVDGTDNFPSRFLANDACVMSGKAFVHGGVLQFVGQALTVVPGRGPCYRCVFGQPPPPGATPACTGVAGVIGVLPGVIGTIQAAEAIKYLTGAGSLLVGRLLTFDALSMEFREVAVKKNPACAACGENPSFTGTCDQAEIYR